jgi:hypothetical protein
MKHLLITDTPAGYLSSELTQDENIHSTFVISSNGHKAQSSLKALYHCMRTGQNIILTPQRKNWFRTKEGREILSKVKEMTLVRQYDASWLNENEQKEIFGFKKTSQQRWKESLSTNRHFRLTLPVEKKILFVGDVHGHFKQLQEIVKPHLNPETFIVFLGDYVSKGPHSLKCIEWIYNNIFVPERGIGLIGNHELHLEDWAGGLHVRKEDFVKTWPDTQNNHKKASTKFARKFISKLYLTATIEQGDKIYSVSHGGLDKPANTQKPAHYIYGPGTPNDDIDAQWASTVLDLNNIQLHGHRNASAQDCFAQKNSWNLEGIESAEEIRCVLIHNQKPHCIVKKTTMQNKLD